MEKPNTIVKGFSLPEVLYKQAIAKARKEDRCFSSYIRRVIKDDLLQSGHLSPESETPSSENKREDAA